MSALLLKHLTYCNSFICSIFHFHSIAICANIFVDLGTSDLIYSTSSQAKGYGYSIFRPADNCSRFPLSWVLRKPQMVLFNAELKKVRGEVRWTCSVNEDNAPFAVRCSKSSVLINQAMWNCCCLKISKLTQNWDTKIKCSKQSYQTKKNTKTINLITFIYTHDMSISKNWLHIFI